MPALELKTKKAGTKLLRGRLPSKRSINLAAVNDTSINYRIAIPAIVLIVLLAALFSKFAVIDRLNKVIRARNEVAQVQALLDADYDKIAEFGELTEKYAHYTYSGMTQDEINRVNRIETIDLIRDTVQPRSTVNSWSVKGNTLTLNITAATLREINEIAQDLESNELVSFCTVSAAATNDIIENNAVKETDVTADVIVYLQNPEEEGEEA